MCMTKLECHSQNLAMLECHSQYMKMLVSLTGNARVSLCTYIWQMRVLFTANSIARMWITFSVDNLPYMATPECLLPDSTVYDNVMECHLKYLAMRQCIQHCTFASPKSTIPLHAGIEPPCMNVPCTYCSCKLNWGRHFSGSNTNHECCKMVEGIYSILFIPFYSIIYNSKKCWSVIYSSWKCWCVIYSSFKMLVGHLQ